MNEIARDTYDYDKFAVVSQLLWESMEGQRPAAWRIVFKGLTLLEHLVKHGSERVVDDARNHGHVLRSLQQFNYYEGTVDRGLGVREKSKQIMELLSDDERIREERQKAKKLREKFGGGKMGGVSGGGGGSAYSGYGNDNWGSGGYGEGGIGSGESRSSGGGRYDNDSSAAGYGGRYDNEPSTRAPAASAQPTFANLPDEAPKKIKKKSKKKMAAAATPAPAAPEVDLFSFDDPAPAAAPSSNDDFAGFQSAGASSNDPFGAPSAANDDFGDFASARQSTGAADPFASAPAQQQPTAAFDAFGGGMMNNNNMMGGGGMNGGMNSNNMMGGGMNNNMMNNNVMGGGMNSNVMGGGISMNNNMMGGGSKPKPAPADDDFGDFAAAAPTKAAAPVSNDPLSKLISLDGLAKNTKKEDKLNQPIVVNQAAASYLQEKDKIAESMKKGSKGNTMSFEGIDGLHKSSGGMMMAPVSSMGMNPNVMGSGMSNIGSMMDPAMMSQNQINQQQQGFGGMQQGNHFGGMQQGGMQPGNQFGGMNPQMMKNNMGGGMMNGGGMQGNMQGGMMNQGGGMPGNMQGGSMMNQGGGGMQGGMNQQQMFMMQQQMMNMQGGTMQGGGNMGGGF